MFPSLYSADLIFENIISFRAVLVLGVGIDALSPSIHLFVHDNWAFTVSVRIEFVRNNFIVLTEFFHHHVARFCAWQTWNS